MDIVTPDELFNDQEINYLADLFLAHLRRDRSTREYRYLRNAVILYSRGATSIDRVYELVGKCAEVSAKTVRDGIEQLIGKLKEPAHELFNRAYAPPDVPYDTRPIKITMSSSSDTDSVVSFLGLTFLYLIISNYNKYDYIEIAE